MSKNKGVQLNCFSPPVMLATLITESLLTIYTLWRYKMTVLGRLAVFTLIALAAFQLSEYRVCTGYGFSAEQWSRIGFVMITTLPPLGIHMLHVLAGKPRRRLVVSAYATMTAFIVFFLTYHTAFIGHKCTGNYVIFQMGPWAGGAYGIYYYGWLLTALLLGANWANELMRSTAKAARRKLEAVRGLIIGYLVFLIPTALANSVKPSTRAGIPSIMCGFAVLFALILVFYILPRSGQHKHNKGLTKAQN